MMQNVLSKVFIKLIGGTRNERIIRSLRHVVEEQVNPLEPQFTAMSDDELRSTTAPCASGSMKAFLLIR